MLLSDSATRSVHLFDLSWDPGEKEDLSRQNEDVYRRMQAALYDWDYELRMSRSRFKARHPKLSSKQLEKLKSLGYVR
jgi:hypothetical protein